ncbi:MAG: SET domain-containing protein-lysine N-methyltransferase [Planctomycetota bacterium]|nr:SET domain-containing protein-lysine N-methyltransferase [Planctomycetota bacterium]
MTTRSATQPFVHVKDSGIHGKGLFASRAIPADTLILTIEGRPTKRDGTYVIWSEGEDGDPEGLVITNDARYVNHSLSPNAAFFDLELWSLKAIRKGAEVTHHYGPDWDGIE